LLKIFQFRYDFSTTNFTNAIPRGKKPTTTTPAITLPSSSGLRPVIEVNSSAKTPSSRIARKDVKKQPKIKRSGCFKRSGKVFIFMFLFDGINKY
jgi:hypothetical protein